MSTTRLMLWLLLSPFTLAAWLVWHGILYAVGGIFGFFLYVYTGDTTDWLDTAEEMSWHLIPRELRQWWAKMNEAAPKLDTAPRA